MAAWELTSGYVSGALVTHLGTDYRAQRACRAVEPPAWPWEPVAGGGGAVDSVNGETGVVVLDAADIGAAPADSVPSWVTVFDLNDETDLTAFTETGTGSAALVGGVIKFTLVDGEDKSLTLTDTSYLTSLTQIVDVTGEIRVTSVPPGADAESGVRIQSANVELNGDGAGGADAYGSAAVEFSAVVGTWYPFRQRSTLLLGYGTINGILVGLEGDLDGVSPGPYPGGAPSLLPPPTPQIRAFANGDDWDGGEVRNLMVQVYALPAPV